jgi:hypothetical protein
MPARRTSLRSLSARVGRVNRGGRYSAPEDAAARDIGADTVGLLVPGGSIAVKVAKLAIDANQQRTSS